MKQFLTDTILLLIAITLGTILIPFAIVITPLYVFIKDGAKPALNKVGCYFKGIAVGIDQLGNISLDYAFNLLLIKPNGYQFGNLEETISSVLGKNLLTGTLTKAGKALANLLDFIQPNHCVNSINNKI